MEPLTAVTVLVAQYGLQQLVRAIGGDPELVTLAEKVVGALSAGEDMLATRLTGIESRLDEVLRQRYQVAVRAGLRTLVDAGSAADPVVRTNELCAAQQLFREAAAAASPHSHLQTALAERYLVLYAVSPWGARTLPATLWPGTTAPPSRQY